MAEVQTLEQRFESITVQDENYDSNAPVVQHKTKVRCRRYNHFEPQRY